MEYRTGIKVFTNWTIEKELGEGATGKVFEIRKTDYGITTRSALKVIRVPHSASDIRAALAEGMDEQSVSSYFKGFVDEIVKEIVIMSNLKSHPNIVSYEDHHVTEHDGKLGWDILIRMELLTPLYDYQLRHPMQEQDVLRMGVELTDALSFCQKKGLMHRDIKPENIFVSETGQFKLGDFGVARTVEKTTGGLSRKGTEKYMAPEVYLGRPYGPSVDIYSLGLVLYSFLNHGRLPFYPLDKKEITFADRENALGRRMNGDVLPPPAAASDRLAQVILKACAYRSGDRYQSAAEMHEALKQILYGGQIQAEKTADPARSEKSYEPEPEEKTVGMVEEPPEEPEEKTVGMVEEPPEEKPAGTIPVEREKIPERTSIQTSEEKSGNDPVKSAVRKETVIGLIGILVIIIAVLALGTAIWQKNHYINPSYETDGLDYSDEVAEMTEEDIEAVVDICLNCPKDSSGGLTGDLVITWLEENGYSFDEDSTDDTYTYVPIRGGIELININTETGSMFTFIEEVPDAQAVYETIRDQIRERSHIEYEPNELSGYDEGCGFYDGDTLISLYVNESTGEIYITAF